MDPFYYSIYLLSFFLLFIITHTIWIYWFNDLYPREVCGIAILTILWLPCMWASFSLFLAILATSCSRHSLRGPGLSGLELCFHWGTVYFPRTLCSCWLNVCMCRYAIYKTRIGYGLHLRKLKQGKVHPHSITSPVTLSGKEWQHHINPLLVTPIFPSGVNSACGCVGGQLFLSHHWLCY